MLFGRVLLHKATLCDQFKLHLELFNNKLLCTVVHKSLGQDMNKEISLSGYQKVVKKATQVILDAQEHFLRQSNQTSITLYWKIGKLLSEAVEEYQWGEQLYERLSHDLSIAFKNSRGYSPHNLRRMRQFYCEYEKFPELLEIAKGVRWSTNLSIMHKVKDLVARRFYLEMARETLCSRDIIGLQIRSQAYERACIHDKNHNFHITLPEKLAAKADNILKASYFLEISKPFIGSKSLLEKQIENEMMSRIKEVIMMLGKGFAFIGNQYRIVAGNNEYFIDLLFMNRILQTLFCVEIKAGKFKAEYAGKMNLYLGILDDYVKLPHENPSIGLILCTSKNSIDVDYALRGIHKPMGVAEIKLSKVLPKELIGKLPDPQELKDELLHELGEMKDSKNG